MCVKKRSTHKKEFKLFIIDKTSHKVKVKNDNNSKRLHY